MISAALTLVGAGFGAVLRYVLGGWINHKLGPEFPWGTLAVNVVGCFVLGLLEGVSPRDAFLLLVLGKGPVVVEAVGHREEIEAALVGVRGVLPRGLITMTEVELYG